MIGIGQRALNDYIPALYQLSREVEFAGACDIDPTAESRLHQALLRHGNISPPRFFAEYTDALDWVRPDIAIVATPHNTHLGIAHELLDRGVPFLKEKPFAMTMAEAEEIARLIEKNQGYMRLCLQRRKHPLYIHAREALARIGRIRHFEATYQLNADAYRVGWRARHETSGGGAIIDMGYHLIDVLQWFFGSPATVYATTAPKMIPTGAYEVEETVLANLTYASGTAGTLRLSLCETRKDEFITVYGTEGYMRLTRKSFDRFDGENHHVEHLDGDPASASALNMLCETITGIPGRQGVEVEVSSGLEVTSTIDAFYRSLASKHPVQPIRWEAQSA
ncbi:Gfo/Idh/MocA family protein [Streptomyces sp. bgisy034]|uniref:Gfo/Idh/MocA family protein n=1 Tax=Streptomyces sp. bgisy034 TaxID=3413774 RepID=UPI003EB9B908